MWLFALMAYDALSAVPGLVWGTPLVIASCYLIIFTGYSCYKDLSKLIKNIEKQKAPQVYYEAIVENATSPQQSRADVGSGEGSGTEDGSSDPQLLPNVMVMFACAEDGAGDAPPVPPIDDGSFEPALQQDLEPELEPEPEIEVRLF